MIFICEWDYASVPNQDKFMGKGRIFWGGGNFRGASAPIGFGHGHTCMDNIIFRLYFLDVPNLCTN